MAKEINYDEGRSKMFDGIDKTVNAVKVTLGPKGKCVAIQNGWGVPDITRDGATVAKAVDLLDPAENMGAQLVKKAASNTEEQAGDGTSSTSVLIQDIIKSGKKYLIDENLNINEMKSGMLKTVSWVTDYIKNHAVQVDGDLEKIRRVATISANNDPEIGDLIVDCFEKVGLHGVITADMSSGLENSIDVVEGMKIDRGWSSPHFVNKHDEGKSVLENPYILVVSEKLGSLPLLYDTLEMIVREGRPLLIVCDDIDEVVQANLVLNVLQRAISCCVVKGVDFGDNRKNVMEDIAVFVGAQHISPEYGITMAQMNPGMLGSAQRVVVSKDSMIIYNGNGDQDEIDERVEVLRTKEAVPGITSYEKNKLVNRIASLSGGIGVIRAGGAEEAEKRNRKATIDDAILAAKSAIAEGVVPGGGYTLLHASIEGEENFLNTLEGSEKIGAKCVLEALKGITRTIGENSGVNGDILVNTLLTSKDQEPNYGYNAKTGEFGNLVEMGVLDSAKVLRVALENAVSAAAMCLLTSCTITEIQEKTCNCGDHQK